MAPSDKLAWFPLYVRDWMLDEKVLAMTFAERGVYLHLLCMQWLEGSITNNVARLERGLGLASADHLGSSVEVPQLRELVKECFPPHPTLPGRLANPRLLQVATEQRLASEKRRAGGAKGGLRRAQAKLQPGLRESEPEKEPEVKTKTEKTGAHAPPDLSLAPTNDTPSLSAFYATLKVFLYPTPNPSAAAQRENESRDISCLKRQLAGRPQPDIYDAVIEARAQADAGQLGGWIEPRQNFTLRALLAEANGGINTFERFRHAAIKRREIAA